MKYISVVLVIFASHFAVAAEDCSTVPNSKPAFDAKTKKFKGCELVSVEPGSIYAKLGLKTGEVVRPDGSGGNQKMEMKNELKTSTSEVH